MGLTYIEGTVKPTGRRRRAKRVRFLVDSGAVYSVLRRADWQALGLKPERQLEFVLADGTTLTRGVSECTFELERRRATSPSSYLLSPISYLLSSERQSEPELRRAVLP